MCVYVGSIRSLRTLHSLQITLLIPALCLGLSFLVLGFGLRGIGIWGRACVSRPARQ